MTEEKKVYEYRIKWLKRRCSIAQPSIIPNYVQTKLYTDADIDKLVEERISSRGNQPKFSFMPKQTQVSQPIQADENAKFLRQFVKAIKQAKRTLAKEPDPAKKKADQIHMDCFLKETIKNMGDGPSRLNENNDSIEDMRKALEDLHINQTKIAKTVQKISRKPKTTCRKTTLKPKTKTK
jgi:hypothetical protein